jgi:hypothetical protein
MIPFFRKIRKTLADDNKPIKYFRYAIGEIVLVVIGILIALQINNWNNELVNKRDEHDIIKNINLEFKQNKKTLGEAIKYHKTILANTKDMMSLIGQSEAVLKKYNVDSLISQSLDYIEYNPSKAVYTDLISSGKLNLISSDSLRLLLFEWSIRLDEKIEAYKTVDEISQTLLLPYLTKNASLKNIDSYSIVKWKEKSKLSTNYYKMFQDLEFENNMENQVWDITNYIMALESLEKATEKVIEKTKREL